jgi:prepilin-type N-terminal cleavage/methylation domain-containing protein
MKTNERGMTLLETMVAIVILAIAILHMAIVPLLSQAAIKNSQATARATTAGKDQIEKFVNIINRTYGGSNPYAGYDTLWNKYGPLSGNTSDSFLTQDGIVQRHWWLTKHGKPAPSPVDSGYMTVRLNCVYKMGLNRTDSVQFTTDIAKRDTLPWYRP